MAKAKSKYWNRVDDYSENQNDIFRNPVKGTTQKYEKWNRTDIFSVQNWSPNGKSGRLSATTHTKLPESTDNNTDE